MEAAEQKVAQLAAKFAALLFCLCATCVEAHLRSVGDFVLVLDEQHQHFLSRVLEAIATENKPVYSAACVETVDVPVVVHSPASQMSMKLGNPHSTKHSFDSFCHIGKTMGHSSSLC